MMIGDESTPTPDGAGRGRRSRAPRTVGYFRERLYATFTGLAIVTVVAAGDHADPRHAFLALALGVIGITIAGLVSEFIAHLLIERTVADRHEVGVMLQSAGGALATLVLPLLFVGLWWAGVMEIDTALNVAKWIYVATLGAVGWLAVRRSTLAPIARLLVLVALVGLGILVVVVQALAKSV